MYGGKFDKKINFFVTTLEFCNYCGKITVGDLIMNLIISSTTGEAYDCDKNADESALINVFVQYGYQHGIQNSWEEIIKLDGPTAKKRIDMLLELLQNNSKNNGFFDDKQDVRISYNGFGFKLNDYNLYYIFFNNLKDISNSQEGQQNKGSVVFNAIKQTIKDYFGVVLEAADMNKKLLTFYDEKCEFPSIAKQRDKGATPTEVAAVAHNLWLLAGKESFYISSKKSKIDNTKRKFLEDGYTFNVVNTGNGYRLCDIVSSRYDMLEASPVDMIKQNKKIAFGTEIYYGTHLKELKEEHSL